MLFSRYPVIAPVALSIALLITSCSDSKTSQCQRLIKAVNHGTLLIDTKKGQQVSSSLKLSKDLKNVTQELEKLNLKDPKLKAFETSFIKIFDHLSQAIGKASKALGDTKTAEASSDGTIKIQKARKEIDSALTTAAKTGGKQSDTLGVQLNKYCSPEESIKN